MKCEVKICSKQATKKACIFNNGISVTTFCLCDYHYDITEKKLKEIDNTRVAEGLLEKEEK